MVAKTVCFLLIFCLTLVLSSFGKCSVSGTAPFFKNKVIKTFYHDNYLTFNPVLVAKALIDGNGNFAFDFEIGQPTLLFLKISNYRVDFYMEPDSKVNVKIGAPDSNSIQLVNQDVHVEYEVSGSSLNAHIAKVGADIDWFITSNYQKFMLKAAKPICDTFVPYMQKIYAGVDNPFFQTVLKYRLALLELAAYRSNRYLIDKYLRAPILYNNYDYFDFFNQIFHHYLLQFSKTRQGEQLFKTINYEASYLKSYEIFKNDKTIDIDTLRELVFLKGLYELYFEPEFDREAVLECIRQATFLTQYSKNRNIAVLIYEKLTRFNKGNPAPDFELTDEEGKPKRLSSYKGKVVILTFGAKWNKDYLAELQVIEKYSRKFGKKVQILNLLLDEPDVMLSKMHKENKNWKLLLAGGSPEILDLYSVKSLPQFFIISKGGWFIEAPAEPPSKWPTEKFEAFFQVR